MVRNVVTAAVVSAMIVLPGPALAAPCAGPADEAAFAMAALKSRMMVLSLGCGTTQGYNAAVIKFMREFNAGQRDLDAWFARTSGRRGAGRRDTFVTQISNLQSLELVRGEEGCEAAAPLFARVMAATPASLPALATSMGLQRAAWPPSCPSGLPVPSAATVPAQRKPAAVPAGLGAFDPTSG